MSGAMTLRERFSLARNFLSGPAPLRPTGRETFAARSPRDAEPNPTEALILATWRDVLRIHDIAITDNFFELGGDSLLALRSLSGIRERTGVEIRLRSLFESPTAQALARRIEELTGT